MDLLLAVVLSCTDEKSVVQPLDSDKPLVVVFADAIRQYGITIRPEHLVAVDKGSSPPQIVFRWELADVIQVVAEQISVRNASGHEQKVRLPRNMQFAINPGDQVFIADQNAYDTALDGRPAHRQQLTQIVFPMVEAIYERVVHVKPPAIKDVVRQSYDTIAEEFLEWTQGIRVVEREKYTSLLCNGLVADAQVLELGCGAGIPTTKRLAERFQVTGVDISSRQIELARINIPNAQFLCADMTKLGFPVACFDAIAAFYSIVHVPRDEQAHLISNIHQWLRPNGLFVAAFGANAQSAGYDDNWLGAPMYWSSFDSETNKRMVEEAGFHILSAEEETAIEEDEGPTTFLWIVAQKSK